MLCSNLGLSEKSTKQKPGRHILKSKQLLHMESQEGNINASMLCELMLHKVTSKADCTYRRRRVRPREKWWTRVEDHDHSLNTQQ